MAQLRLSLLGAFEASLDGKLISGLKTDKARALLIYLAVERGRPHRRQALAGMLWPDYPEQGARANLRHALANLRQVLGEEGNEPPFLWVEGETLQFNSQSDCRVDAAEFERLAASNDIPDLEAALALYRGGFLEGFTLKGSPEFDNWTAALRQRYLEQASAALGRLAESYEEDKALEKAMGLTRRRLELLPWEEDAHRQLMRLLALNGQRAAALAQYEACCKVLKEELGVEPVAETKRLQTGIRDGELGAARLEKVRQHNLPAQLTSFIGREKEIEQIKVFLGWGARRAPSHSRLVTLTGSGGAGKTRLALQTGTALLEQYSDGVWLVELAPLSDAELVVQTVARALGMRLEAGAQALAMLEDYLDEKHLLLILDNCEHLVEACARLADALLKACPHLHILATSREALEIEGEVPYRVPPLAFPQAEEALENLEQYEAVRLFLERAETASPGFQLTEGNAPAIVQICQRLDGIPLALELAAARVKVLRVEEIAQRLDDCFRLLTGGSRAALPRYQTLRASIDWSYELLSSAEQRLLRRLSVFAGGWVLEAAEYVGCGEGIEACDVLDLLSQLVNKSLVTVEARGAETRYGMLETIRQYAQEKLAEAGEEEGVRDRHLMYYVALAERVEDKIRGPDQAAILSHLENELRNIRLAFELCTSLPIEKAREVRLTEQGLRLGAALLWFWHCRGRQNEGHKWLIFLLARETEQRAIPDILDEFHSPSKAMVRAKALLVASSHKLFKGEYIKANELLLESRELYRELGSQGKKGYACVLKNLGVIASYQGNSNLSEKYIEESLSIYQEEGDRLLIGESLDFLGTVARQKREQERARVYFEKSLALHKEIGDQEGTAYALFQLGALFLDPFSAADPVQKKQARTLLEESREIFLKINSIDGIFWPLEALGTLSWMQGDYAKAEAYLEEALSLVRNQWITNSLVYCLIALGRLALSQGDRQQAAERFEESLAISLNGEPQFYIIWSLTYAGLLDWEAGDFEQASQKYVRALEIQQRLGLNFPAQTFLGSGRVFLARGEYGLARTYLDQALEISQSNGDQETVYNALEAFAILAARRKEKASWAELERAARLLGATEAWHMEWRLTRTPRERQERESAGAYVRVALGEAAFAKTWEEGTAMTLEQAIVYAKEVDTR